MGPHRPKRALPWLFALALAALLSVHAGQAAETRTDPVNVSVTQHGDTVRITAEFRVPVSAQAAWEVLTDFEHMPAFLHSLTESHVVAQSGKLLMVRQKGESRLGPLTVAFESLREVELTPYQTIRSRTLQGTLRGMEGETWLVPVGNGMTRVFFKARVIPDSALAALLPTGLMRDELKAQFQIMREEMLRRDGLQLGKGHQPPPG